MLDSILESSLVIDLYYSLYDFTWKFNIFFIYNLFIFFIGSVWFLQIVYFFLILLIRIIYKYSGQEDLRQKRKATVLFPQKQYSSFSLYLF